MCYQTNPNSSQARKEKSHQALLKSIALLEWTWATVSVGAGEERAADPAVTALHPDFHLCVDILSPITGATKTPLSSRWALITFWSSGSSLLIKLFPMWLGLWVVLWSQKLDPKANSEYLEFFTCFLWILFGSCLSIYLCISPVSILLANDSSPVLYYAFFPSLLP